MFFILTNGAKYVKEDLAFKMPDHLKEGLSSSQTKVSVGLGLFSCNNPFENLSNLNIFFIEGASPETFQARETTS